MERANESIGQSSLNDGTQEELTATRAERNRLQQELDQQQQQLIEANHTLQVQESRLGSIKSLVASLSYNIESWTLDDEWDQKTSSTTKTLSTTVVEGMDGTSQITTKGNLFISLKTNNATSS
jgi:chromosome segregation ATPase